MSVSVFISVFLCVCVSFSLSLSVRVERGCAVRVLLQCRQTPDSPIRYYSLCVCLQGSVSSTGEAVLLYTHAQTHTANSSTPSLSAGKHSHCPASTSAHPPPSWLNAYYPPSVSTTSLSILAPLFLILSLFLQFFLFLSLSILSSTLFSLIILILVGPVKRVRQKIQNVCFQTPRTLTQSPCSNLCGHFLHWFCDVEAAFPLAWPLRSWPSASKVGGNLLLTFFLGLSHCFPSSYHFTSCYTGNRLFIPPVKWHLIIIFLSPLLGHYLKCSNK